MWKVFQIHQVQELVHVEEQKGQGEGPAHVKVRVEFALIGWDDDFFRPGLVQRDAVIHDADQGAGR